MKPISHLINVTLASVLLVGCNSDSDNEPTSEQPIQEQPSEAEPLAVVYQQEVVHEFFNDEVTPAYEYAGVQYDAGLAQLVGHSIQPVDLWKNGYPDVYVTLFKGYSTGIDTRTRPAVFRNDAGTLSYATDDTELPDLVMGTRRFATFGNNPGDTDSGLFTVNHETGDNRFGEANIILAGSTPKLANDRLAPLPLEELTGRANTVNAHGMAGGDLNGNGRTDFYVADDGGHNEDFSIYIDDSYYLIQQSDGTWTVEYDSFLDNISYINPTNDGFESSAVLDVHIADLTNNGLGDLLIGATHQGLDANSTCIYFNQGADDRGVPIYSLEESWCLDASDFPFGIDNSSQMYSWSADLDGNGYNDLIVLYTQIEPYYRDYEFVVLKNDGDVLTVDHTAMQHDSSIEFTDDAWSDFFNTADVNGNGYPDFIGTANGKLRLWLNDTTGKLVEVKVANETNLHLHEGSQWVDFGNNVFGSLTFNFECSASNEESECTELRVFFSQVELNREVMSLEDELVIKGN